jgi:hypothetical protein
LAYSAGPWLTRATRPEWTRFSFSSAVPPSVERSALRPRSFSSGEKRGEFIASRCALSCSQPLIQELHDDSVPASETGKLLSQLQAHSVLAGLSEWKTYANPAFVMHSDIAVDETKQEGINLGIPKLNPLEVLAFENERKSHVRSSLAGSTHTASRSRNG